MELIDKTIGRLISERAKFDADKVAIEMGGWSCTYKQLNTITDYLAVDMDRYNIRKGTHVGIWSVNSPNWVFTFLALIKLGAVPILINTCLRDDEIVGIVDYSDVEILYFGVEYKTIIYEEVINRIRNRMPKIRHYIHIDEYEPIGVNRGRYGDFFISEEDTTLLEQKKSEVSSSDICCMIFTSGTTSVPKGVMLSHYNLVNNAHAMVEAMHWSNNDKMCITVPMFHCFGITAGIISCTLCGASMCIIPYFKTVKVWNMIAESRCTILNGVPSMFLALVRKQRCMDVDASGIKSGIIAGSPFTCEEYEEICNRFYNMNLIPSYGQTETSPCVTIVNGDEPMEKRCCNAGKTIEHVEVRIVDLERGTIVNDLQPGEIQVRGYNIMLGYYNLPKSNKAVFTEDGWLKTGDIGRLESEGNLVVTGRLKEMIIRAGENISPQEIEQLIRKLDWVKEVKVVGVPAEVIQEEIAACIIPKKGYKISKDELLEYLKPKLAHYKLPVYIFEFEEFPMNACGKINLKKLKDVAAKMSITVSNREENDIETMVK